MNKKIEILAIDEGRKVTFAFIDTIVSDMDKLYHRCFWCGKERTVCIDEEKKIYMVSITVKKTKFFDMYDTIICAIIMVKEHFEIDLSEYNQNYLNIDTYVDLFG